MGDKISDYISECEMRDVRSRFDNTKLADCVIENMARIRGYKPLEVVEPEMKHKYQTGYKFL